MTNRDIIQAVSASFLWALCYPLISLAVADAAPISIAAIRALVAGAGLLIYARLGGRQWPTRRILGAVALSGLGFTSMGFSGMFLAGGRITPGLASVLANVQPLLAAALGAVVLRESIGGRRGTALLLGFAGIVITAWPTLAGDGASSAVGVAFVLMGAVGVAIGNVILKRVARVVDPVVAIGFQLLVGAIPLILIAILLGEGLPQRLTLRLAASLAVLSVFGTAIVSVLWLDLLARNELVRVNIYTFLTPVIALLIAATFFGERLHVTEWIGSSVVLAAVVVITLTRDRHATIRSSEQTPEVL